MTIDSLFDLSKEERKTIISNTAKELNIPIAFVEKDLWICIVLKHLFSDFKHKEHLVLKVELAFQKAII
ncbi:hypothetical protein NPA08_00245 [Mycoplasmopsis citelli]|uniref:hypothetical protein n=1 Tax=Mycoplasmopsis citelli TaxID=171281 RepID=UPI002114E6DF|nr:hypothetical protein [Mycoplasmopsis citelli]UUD36259.1 hypothetical protein NPA08_00245 [Mycoplasmopsis citelli]